MNRCSIYTGLITLSVVIVTTGIIGGVFYVADSMAKNLDLNLGDFWK